ncbi:slit homolog 3 protein-like [Hydractinia symbiolongicarpus]|uniref:slit homolog 3 protein-like n=1 Tax=Hydractinia symbiolongicarpus TaxID=13093 RepID=UPI0025500F61|nr:slit homolog 3 protein-like [Hydractinia symbiolongicarpus]
MMTMLSLQLRLLVVAQLLLNNVQACPLLCSCNGGKVDCGETVLTKADLKKIGQTISKNTKELIFRYYKEDIMVLKSFPILTKLTSFSIKSSSLTEIPDGLSSKMPLLRSFISRRNKIRIIRKDQFLGLNSLAKVTIKHGLKVIEGGAFSRLPNLTRIEVSNNNLTVLTSRSFSNLKNLKFLYLRHNHIAKIQDSAFFNLKKLIVLNLFKNKIKHLSTKAFNGLPSLSRLKLTHNPLVCDCKFYTMLQGLKNAKRDIKLNGTCYLPTPLITVPIWKFTIANKSQCTICDLTSPCLNNAQCVSRNSTHFYCNCTKEYFGEKCQTKIGTMQSNGKSKFIIPLVGSFLALLWQVTFVYFK